MSMENYPGVVLMLPFQGGTMDRIDQFYRQIGWEVLEESERQLLTTVFVPVESDQRPSLTYWHTDTVGRLNRYDELTADPPERRKLVEVSLIVPTNRDVERLLSLGGRALQQSIYELPDRASDSLSFKFSDPFNYLLGIKSASKAETTEIIPDSKYVTTFTKWETDQTVALITPESFVDFAIESGSSSMIARRAFRAIVQAASRDPQSFEEFLERSEGKIIGLNPNKIRQLIGVIEESKRNPHAQSYIINFGPKAFEVLDNLANALHTDN